MHSVRRQLRRFTWFALFAIFGLALAPTVSHALSGSGPDNPWAEICSVAGGKLVSDVDASGSRLPAAGVHPEHCPLCAHGAGPVGLPPPSPAFVPVSDGAAFLPAPFADAPQSLFTWAVAQPRAPPVSC